jgi:hypothetical protein
MERQHFIAAADAGDIILMAAAVSRSCLSGGSDCTFRERFSALDCEREDTGSGT